MMHSGVYLMMFGNVFKHCIECFIYPLNQTKMKEKMEKKNVKNLC